MKVSQLFSIYSQLHWGESASLDVSALCADSREVEPGSVFVATRGATVDSHDFLEDVCAKGAIALVVENRDKVPENFDGTVLVVENGKIALNQLASRFYGEPAEKMFCVGITGTNGKSTITFLIEAILREFGWKTGVIGTIDHHLEDKVWKTQLTTPDTMTFHKRLAEFASLGAKACCMEVTSIALEQNRVGSISYDAVVFTNLTRDHLDYHGSMENYIAAKELLFTEVLAQSNKKARFAIVNSDDPAGRGLRVHEGARHWTYGRGDADISFQVVEQTFRSSKVKVLTPRGEGIFNLPMAGLFNVYNAMSAIGVGLAAGVSLEKCLSALEKIKGVPGRLESVDNEQGLNIFVDYAHTDDALQNVLNTLNSVREASGSRGRILTLFGCGGDRDNGKRPLMGKAAWELSDLIFVTSDNPRTEDPQRIVDHILEGIPESQSNSNVFVELDRKVAIERALRMANEEDVVLIAGKGHEDYQIIGTERIDFSDVEIVKEVLACLPN